MMRNVLAASLAWAVALTLTLALRAEEKKEVTLKGQVVCACELGQGQACHAVIQVKEGDTEVTYYFRDAGKDTYHDSVCGHGRRDATVTGLVAKENGKKWITPSKVEYVAKK
jgi:hypothetical protein